MEITKQTQDDFVEAIKSTLNTHAFIKDCRHTFFVHYFKGFGWADSVCRVHLFTHPDATIVVFEDMGNDTGTSITNASEQLAEEIIALKKLNRESTAWMECYPHYDKVFVIDHITYSYDTVEKKYWQPQWSRCSNATLTEFIRKHITR